MINFQQYYEFLTEDSMLESGRYYNHDFIMAPSKALGLQNTLNTLPQKLPYGFWVNKWGHWIEVGSEKHVDVAKALIQNYNNWAAGNRKEPLATDNPYKALWDNGYLRVVDSGYWDNDSNIIYWEHPSKSYAPTKSQAEFFKALNMNYYKSIEKDKDAAVLP